MGCVDVYETVHMVWLWYHSYTCVCDVTHEMGFIPILCDCDVQFQYVSIQIAVALCEQFHKIACKKRSRIQKESYRVNEPLNLVRSCIMLTL